PAGGPSVMTVEYIRYRIPAKSAADFEAAYARAAEALAAAPECLGYELTRGVDEPDQYVLRIVWTSLKAQKEDYLTGEHFPAFLGEIERYGADILDLRLHEDPPVHGDGGAVPSLYDWLGGEEALL